MKPRTLTRSSYASGVAALAASDPGLARILQEAGRPPFWYRAPGFATLVHVILEQQVSMTSARAAFERLRDALGDITPTGFLALSGARLKRIGFSRQKAGYCRGLARAIGRGDFDLDRLAGLDDHAARGSLIGLKGIGPWTADVYLLIALRRPDVWPAGDLALAVAYQERFRLRARPSPSRLASEAARWTPWRAVAARMLWHDYLSARGQVSPFSRSA